MGGGQAHHLGDHDDDDEPGEEILQELMNVVNQEMNEEDTLAAITAVRRSWGKGKGKGKSASRNALQGSDRPSKCANCGKEPEQKPTKTRPKEKKSVSTLKILEQKLEKLSSQLEVENEPTKQQELIKSIDSLIDVIAKLKSN